MAMKQPLRINFAQGLDQKTDPKQVQAGRFLKLENTVFDKGGLLQSRNGFGALSTLPDSSSMYLTTLNGNLTAISSSILALASPTNTWVSKGSIQPLSLDTLPLIRSNTNQSQVDAVIAANGLVGLVWTDQDPANLANPAYKYAVADSITGQNVVSPTLLPAGLGVVTGSPRIFNTGNWFIILFTNLIAGNSHLQYLAISTANPTVVMGPTDIVTNYTPSTRVNYDAVSVDGQLVIAYNTLSGGQSVNLISLSPSFNLTSPVVFAGSKATIMSVCADTTNPTTIIYATFWDSTGSTMHTLAVDKNLNTILAPTSVLASGTILNVASNAQNSKVDIYYEVSNSYSYDSGIASDYINHKSVTQSGSVSSATTIVRGLGLGSKSASLNGVNYFLGAYQSELQNGYYLINASQSVSTAPIVVAKLAYQNGGGYLSTGLPWLTINGNTIQVPYLFKDLVTSVNKNTNVPSGTQVSGIYSQTGINMATIELGSQSFDTVEIGSALHMSGGFMWMYDGYLPVEHNFFVYPEDLECTTATTGGNMTAQIYYYQAVYEWTDNQGNAHRSAPSVPVKIDISASMTSTNTVTVNVPTLRLTYKIANPVKITLYRWSTTQQEYFQATSITTPTLNDLTVDSVAFTDTLADSAILGNALIYTTGGVIENLNSPATNIMTLWNTRLFSLDSEDKNLLWYSKPVIENTPVEMSDLQTLFVAPTIGSSGSTGPITALGAMDDKLIIFKRDAIDYVSGSGPDILGNNNNFTDPISILSPVGCTNQQSIVIVPMGLMFQSDKGIWLLDRSLGTRYIGAPVEDFALAGNVLSAVNVPETNQVRFTMDSGVTLMYDYFFNQWGTFVNIPGVSSCIYNSLHTYLNKFGQVFQETPGSYLDGSSPVLISFTTSWINLAGIQGYQRIYELGLLGTYISPHRLNVQVAFDFMPPVQQSTIKPKNATGLFGSDSLYGQTSPFGGPGNLETWRIQTNTQKCSVFQVSVNEIFDPTFGSIAGQGFTLSEINCVIGVKKGYHPYSAANSVG